MSKPPLHLISFRYCPFVQRSLIILHEKGIDFELSYIDLYNKPDWFLKISPLGKVPILQVGEVVLFESAVISEYLDEVNPPSLHPADPLLKAQNRAVIEFSSAILGTQFMMKGATNKEDFDTHYQKFTEQMRHLQTFLNKGDFINGAKPHLVDFACVPLLERCFLLEKHLVPTIFDGLDALKAWAQRLLALPSVQKSIPADMEEVYLAGAKKLQDNDGDYQG